MAPDIHTSSLQELYASETAKIRERFEDSGDGKAAIRERAALIDSVVRQLWNEVSANRGIEDFFISAIWASQHATW